MPLASPKRLAQLGRAQDFYSCCRGFNSHVVDRALIKHTWLGSKPWIFLGNRLPIQPTWQRLKPRLMSAPDGKHNGTMCPLQIPLADNADLLGYRHLRFRKEHQVAAIFERRH